MKTRGWLLTTWMVSTARHGVVVAKHTAFGVPKPIITTTTTFLTRTIPRGGQQRYDYQDYEEAYKNPSSRGDSAYDDRYGSSRPDYYEDYNRGPAPQDDGDRSYFDEDRGYYDDRGTSSMVRYPCSWMKKDGGMLDNSLFFISCVL